MSFKPIISVIVPIYNASKYISDCLKSLLDQDIKVPYEIICVNDGSKDNSLSILESFSKKYNNIVIISQENGGVTSARKAGVKASKGEWITFVDADDSLLPDALSNLYDVEIDGHDIIIGDVFQTSTPGIFSIKDYRLKIIQAQISPAPWAKLFRRQLFTEDTLNIPRSIKSGEDMVMNLRLAFETTKPVLNIGKIVYKYNRVPSSVTHTFVKTPEYEELFHEILFKSIPQSFRDDKDYISSRISSKINAWRCLNLWSLSTSSMRSSNFYKDLQRDIQENNYSLRLDEKIHLYYTSFPMRIIAILLNLWTTAAFKINNNIIKRIKN